LREFIERYTRYLIEFIEYISLKTFVEQKASIIKRSLKQIEYQCVCRHWRRYAL